MRQNEAYVTGQPSPVHPRPAFATNNRTHAKPA